MQLFLVGFIIISICEIFTIGWFPLDGAVRRVSLVLREACLQLETDKTRPSLPYTLLPSLRLHGFSS